MKAPNVSLRSVFSWEVIFVLLMTGLMTGMYFFSFQFIEFMEMKAWDLHFLQRGIVEPSGEVAFVTVDEESVNTEGRWPWPRRLMARLLDAVQSYNPRAIGLDMGWFEPDSRLRSHAVLDLKERFKDGALPKDVASRLDAIAEEEDDDVILANTIRNMKVPLVVGHFFYSEEKPFNRTSEPEENIRAWSMKIVKPRVDDQFPARGALVEGAALEMNIPLVRQAAKYMGSFNVENDRDGNVRRMPLVIRYRGMLFPSLALQLIAAAYYPEKQPQVIVNEKGIEHIVVGSKAVPTNRKGEILLNFYGPAHIFPNFSATAVLRDRVPRDCPDNPRNCLKDKIVVIGNTTIGLHDMRPTAFSPVFPGLELHCVVMENILKDQFVYRSTDSDEYTFYDLGALFGLAVLFLILQKFLRGFQLSVMVAGLLAGYVGLTHLAFLKSGLWLNHVYPLMNLVIAYIGTSVHRYVKEEREKRMVRQTFSLYVPRSVVEEMLAHPERLKLGGEKKELSVFFSDIRGFTTLSEKLPPEELVPQLNEYLTRMTQVVFDHQGTLDKYIGDAIMAIFGAPLTQEDHAARACATALDMHKILKELHQEWQDQGRPVLQIGIGINTGTMMVGNMGSERRFDYTVLGDNVNLASRLEGLTKKYGVTIVVSESTWEAVDGAFVGRELDVVRVKGKLNPVGIYELMGRKEEADRYREPLEAYAEGVRRFRGGHWQDALTIFKEVEKWWPGDPPSQLYQKRCSELLENPPREEWSYVTVLDSK